MVRRGGSHDSGKHLVSTQRQLAFAVAGAEDEQTLERKQCLERLYFRAYGLFAHWVACVVAANLIMAHAALPPTVLGLLEQVLPCGYEELALFPQAVMAWWADPACAKVGAECATVLGGASLVLAAGSVLQGVLHGHGCYSNSTAGTVIWDDWEGDLMSDCTGHC